jgi:predicted unusual protein kinase regulating ubiquinone biosynthesis (AarF/ABC1/UbiB family)
MGEGSDKLATGRVRRGSKLASGLSPRSARLFGTLITSGMRSPEKAAELILARHTQLADAAVEVLGNLRGGAMKIGQLASFIDVDLLPDGYRDVYRDRLSALQAGVEPMSFDQIRPVLDEELGVPLETVFEDFEHDAVAAASVGQVHRAVLPDGRRVAVKVQYPGIAEALRSDLQLASVGVNLARLMAPGVDPHEVMGELRARILEELDFQHEAAQQRVFANAYRGHPFIVIPEVHEHLTRRRVMVSDWVDGASFDEVRTLDQAERDRFGEILYRFFFGSWSRVGRFHTDAHPGNYRLLPDGSVAFFDFGSVRKISLEEQSLHIRLLTAARASDGPETVRVLDALGYLRDASTVDPQLPLELSRGMVSWFADDRDVRITRDYVAKVIGDLSAPSQSLTFMRTYRVPAGEIMLRRVTIGLMAVLGQLEATANWYRISSEWWYDGEPATALGELERGHFVQDSV